MLPVSQVQQQQQQPQQLAPQMAVAYQSGVCLQQGPVASTSDNSGSGSFMLNPYGPPAQTPSMGGTPGMPSPVQQPQTAYILSPTGLQPVLMQQQASPNPVAGLPMQQQVQVVPAGGLHTHQQLGRGSTDSSTVPMVHLSLQVSGNQMAVISNQMYSVAAMSGADLATTPVAAGLFHINITGAQSQVTAARQLITSMLSQVM